MTLFDWMNPETRRTRTAEEARQLVHLHRERLWQAVAGRAGSLTSIAEARGYSDARLRRIVKSIVCGGQAQKSASSRRVTEQLVDAATAEAVAEFAGLMLRRSVAPQQQRRAA